MPALNGPADGGSAPSPAHAERVGVGSRRRPADGHVLRAPRRSPRRRTSRSWRFPTRSTTSTTPSRAATFTAQTNWIVNNRAPLNIAFVSHLGDIVEHQDQFSVEWQRADASLTRARRERRSRTRVARQPRSEHQRRRELLRPVSSRRRGSSASPWYGGYLGAGSRRSEPAEQGQLRAVLRGRPRLPRHPHRARLARLRGHVGRQDHQALSEPPRDPQHARVPEHVERPAARRRSSAPTARRPKRCGSRSSSRTATCSWSSTATTLAKGGGPI